ncbi:MAG: hypothetical protein Q7S22_08800 [Candidatus Micrarchaeota archaeon]|nr:hypothetical protein [Candidatus Micrarchaeota archaeon]
MSTVTTKPVSPRYSAAAQTALATSHSSANYLALAVLRRAGKTASRSDAVVDLEERLFTALLSSDGKAKHVRYFTNTPEKLFELAKNSESPKVRLYAASLIAEAAIITTYPARTHLINLQNLPLSKFKDVRMLAINKLAELDMYYLRDFILLQFTYAKEDKAEIDALLVANFARIVAPRQSRASDYDNFKIGALTRLCSIPEIRVDAIHAIFMMNVQPSGAVYTGYIEEPLRFERISPDDVKAALDKMATRDVARIMNIEIPPFSMQSQYKRTFNLMLDRLASEAKRITDHPREILGAEDITGLLTFIKFSGYRRGLFANSNDYALLGTILTATEALIKSETLPREIASNPYLVLIQINERHEITGYNNDLKQRAQSIIEGNLSYCRQALNCLHVASNGMIPEYIIKPLAKSTKEGAQLLALDFMGKWAVASTYAAVLAKTSPFEKVRRKALITIAFVNLPQINPGYDHHAENNRQFVFADIINNGKYSDIFPQVVSVALDCHAKSKNGVSNDYYMRIFLKNARIAEKPELLSVALKRMRAMPEEKLGHHTRMLLAVHTDSAPERMEFVAKLAFSLQQKRLGGEIDEFLNALVTGTEQQMTDVLELLIRAGSREFVANLSRGADANWVKDYAFKLQVASQNALERVPKRGLVETFAAALASG